MILEEYKLLNVLKNNNFNGVVKMCIIILEFG